MNSLMKATSAIACAAGLTACDRNLGNAITPSPPPTPSEVSESGPPIFGALSQMRSLIDPTAPKRWPSGDPVLDTQTAQYFVMAGYELAQSNCQKFFDKNRLLRSETSFAKDTLVGLATAAGTIAGLAGATTQVLTAVLGTTGIVPMGIDNFNKTFLNADIADTIQPKVRTGMEQYRKVNPATKATPLNAVQLVRSHAELCTLGSMLDMTKAALSKLNVSASPTDSSVDPAPESISPRSGAPFSTRSVLPSATIVTTVPQKPAVVGRNGSYYYYTD